MSNGSSIHWSCGGRTRVRIWQRSTRPPALPSSLPLRLLSASQPLLPADPLPELTLTPAKQHLVDGVEVLCDGLLLFLEVLDLEILLVEPPTAEHQSFFPPLVL